MQSLSRVTVLALGVLLLPISAGCGRSAVAATVEQPTELADAPLASYRVELADLAFEIASALPIDPHVKTRSREQADVIHAWLELDQPRRVLASIERIADWRRGEAHAALAVHCAKAGLAAAAGRHAALAESIASSQRDLGSDVGAPSPSVTQDWQRERILLRVARARELLEPSKTGAGSDRSEDAITDEQIEREVAKLDADVAAGGFDQVRYALMGYASLFERFFGDRERRTRFEEKIRSSWGTLPIAIRVELLIELGEAAIEHADAVEALRFAGDATSIMDGARWSPEDRIPRMAAIAKLRHRGGDVERARADVLAARELFDAQRESIVDIDRAETLLPLAEACHAIGDAPTALSLYERAIEEAVRNPNSRPRAEDLAAACRSMALHGVEPGEKLWMRLRELRAALGDPW